MLSSHVGPRAEARLYQAAAWYQQEEPGTSLWLELLDEFEAVLARICEHVFEGRARRALLSRFPYGLYYVVENNRIVVIDFLAFSRSNELAGVDRSWRQRPND